MSSFNENQESHPKNVSIKPNQPTILANQEKLALSTLKIDPKLYKFPQTRSDKFQVADNLVVYQNDTPVIHKSYGGMIIHQKPEIITKKVLSISKNEKENCVIYYDIVKK